MNPETIKHLFQVATRNHQSGHLKEAENGYRAVLPHQPDNPFLLQQFGLLLAQLGRPKEGVPHVEKSCRLRGDIPAFWNNLGEIYRQVDRLVESMQMFQTALRIEPLFAEARYNLGNVLKQVGRHPEAVGQYSEAVRLKPDYDRAWYNLANTLREEGRVVPAVAAYREAIRLKPDWGDAHLNLANALYDGHELTDAAAEYRRAAELKTDDGDVEESLGNCLVALGHVDEATDVYRRVNDRRPERWLRTLRCELLAPPVPPSSAYIDDYRDRVVEALERYADRGPIELEHLHSSGAEPPMLLAYHGRDDRPIKQQFARLFTAKLPPAEPPRARTSRPRVGFVVTHGHEGVFARCLGELVVRLDTKTHDVALVTSRAGANVIRHMLPAAKFEFVLIPEGVDQAAILLREVGFDVLVYWEVGTDSMNYTLPMFRCARVQAACWGWPVTTGQQAIDDYISSAPLEPEDAENHYTERLVKLETLPTYYARPPVPAGRPSKESFGFATGDHVYLCQQNVRKYQPEFDPVLAGILRADSAGTVAIIADEQPRITELLLNRLRAAMPDVVERVRVVNRLERESYLGLVAAADVVLDTPRYGGGANTVLDAVAAGTPLVTLAGEFHRGRWATAVNRFLGLTDLATTTPDAYVQSATRLTSDTDYRADIARRMMSAGVELFESIKAVHAWDQYLAEGVASARSKR